MTVAARVVEYAIALARVGTTAALALSIGTAENAANRVGCYADLTASAEKLGLVVGGVTGPTFNRTGSQVIAAGLVVQDSTFVIADQADATKTIAFQAGTQSSGFQLTIDVGAQAASRTLSVPVLSGNRTIAVLEQAQTFTSTVLVNGSTTEQTLRCGTFGIQSYSTGNGWFGENTYYNGSNFVYRNNGDAGMVRWNNLEWQLSSAPAGLAGATIATFADLRWNSSSVLTVGVAAAGRISLPCTTGTTLTVSSTQASTTTTTGAQTIAGGLGVAGAIYAANLAASGLTSGRLPIVSTGGLLVDSANLTFGSSNTMIGLRRTPHTWGGSYSGIEQQGSAFAEYYAGGNIQMNWMGNSYDVGGGSFQASEVGTAVMFRAFPLSKLFLWQTAPSVAANAAQTFTTCMSLDDAGLTISPTGTAAFTCAGGGSFANGLTLTGTLQATIVPGIKVTSTPSAYIGSGVEIGFNGTRGVITCYNRTGVAYLGYDFNALDINFQISGTTKLALAATTGAATFADAVVSTGPTQGMGYATGAGGTVTQATNKSTGVTLNKVCGTITLNAANLAAATSVGFTLTNSAIAATDTVIVSIKSAATADSYTITVDAVAAGSCRISIRNVTAGALAEAVVLSFAIIKAVAA